jgi:uncharacterized delta-60 repeat protein
MSSLRNIILILILTKNVLGQGIDGRIDTTFQIGSGANSTVNCIIEQADKKIIVGGFFTIYDGPERNLIVRLNPDGSIDESFVPDQIGWGNNDGISSIMVANNGQILVGGYFTNANGFADSGLKLLNSDGSQATNWYVNGKVYCMAKQPDGKIILGGQCYSYGGTTVRRIFRINPDFSIDSTFNTMTDGPNGGIYSIVIQPDGKILIGGNFNSFKGVSSNHIARLNYDASIDTSFHVGSGFDEIINTIVLQSNNKLVVSGRFTSYSGFPVNYLTRINPNGYIDTTFNSGGAGMNDRMAQLIINRNDQILVGGTSIFTSYNDNPVKHIVRLNIDGTLDVNFDPLMGQDGTIYAMLIQDDEHLVIGGGFTHYDGVLTNHICRIYANNKTGIYEKEEQASITLSPNPASNSLRIDYNGESNDITIINTMGVVVYSEKLKKEHAIINTSTFPPGLYYVKVGGMVKKLVIE